MHNFARTVAAPAAADVATRAPAELALATHGLERLRPVAAQALRELGDGPLQLTGPVRDALDAGRLLRTGDPARLDALEELLRTGAPTNLRSMGSGPPGQPFSSGELFRAEAVAADGTSVSAVVKSADAGAPQETFGWKFGRALGIDHLVPAVGRRPDGSAWIEFRPGVTLREAGVVTNAQLDEALAISYLGDGSLTPAEAAQAARVDRQLLQATDYLTANIDRHANNGLVDVGGSGRVSFIDFGLVGRGARAEGGSVISPALRRFQSDAGDGVVNLDPAVVRYIERRLTPARVEELHAEVYGASGFARTTPDTQGERQFLAARNPRFREGITTRLAALLEHGGYVASPYLGDALTPVASPTRAMEVRGFRNVMAARHQFGFGG
ncbi:MAG: hypothetical protein JWN72_584 [Thermoleophilia bacterium]|nr:hypothetical protein [Thermoleophilia bacterium]